MDFWGICSVHLAEVHLEADIESRAMRPSLKSESSSDRASSRGIALLMAQDQAKRGSGESTGERATGELLSWMIFLGFRDEVEKADNFGANPRLFPAPRLKSNMQKSWLGVLLSPS